MVYSLEGSFAFAIDAAGQVTTQFKLDHESVPEYTLNITASDKGAIPKQTSVEVVIKLININDNNPLFGFQTTTFTIPENISNGSIVADIPVSDPDGLDSAIELKIVGGDGASRLDIVDGKLVTATTANLHFDREVLDKHNVLIKAIDRGNSNETRYSALPSLSTNAP